MSTWTLLIKSYMWKKDVSTDSQKYVQNDGCRRKMLRINETKTIKHLENYVNREDLYV